MRVQTRHANQKCLFKILDYVVQSKDEDLSLMHIAQTASFSRFHLHRIFHTTLGESLGEFLRRIRLERAAYKLLHCGRTAASIGIEAGYAGSEAFIRAFSRAYGVSPTEFRKNPNAEWRLPTPCGIHWNPGERLREYVIQEPNTLGISVVLRPEMRLAVQRFIGDYRELKHAYCQLHERSKTLGFDPTRRGLFTIFHDDYETKPKDSLRSDVGFVLTGDMRPPIGFREILVPSGLFAVTRFLPRSETREAWRELTRDWLPRNGRRPRNVPAMDEYRGWPEPWETAERRLMIGIDMDLGEP